MAKELITVDVSKVPELLRLAEEVRGTKTARILRRDEEDIALVVPIAPRRRVKASRTKADLDAFLSAAGSWKDLVDAEELKEHIASSRGSSRPTVDL